MTKQFAQFQRIENEGPITPETHGEFLYYLQSAMLLALRERGTLTAMQYRCAEEKLRQQRREVTKMLSEKGERP